MKFSTQHKTALAITASIIMTYSTGIMAESSIDWDVETGIAYDSNPYHTPNTSYTDYAQTGNPVINPKVQSGFFIPVKATTQLSDENNAESNFNSEYKLSAAKFLDSDLTNADEYSHEIIIGKTLGPDSTDNPLYAEFTIDINRQTYFDRDDGLPKTTSGGSDISDRYNYMSYGANISYDSNTSSQPYTLTATIEQYNYDDPVGTTQLDHTRIELGVNSQKRLSKDRKFKYGYQYSARSYSDRHARDSAAVITTQTLDYDYHIIDLSLRNRVNKDWVTYFDYQYKQRNDGHVGYNDSTTNKFKIRNIYKTANSRTRLAISYYTIDYANAFNFEDPTQGYKSSDALNIDLKSAFKYGDYQLWTALKLTDKNSTDTRYEYDRYLASLGISLEL